MKTVVLGKADAIPVQPLHVRWLGQVAYADALEMQQALVSERRAGSIQDQLLLLEHPHVITLGTSSSKNHVLLPAEERALLGIEMFETGRGGDVTYHGPGQLVGYPILDLKPDRCDLHRYVRDIEEALIRALRDFDLDGYRKSGLTGVWVNERKIAAIGVRVSSGWITSHGFALNVTTDLRFFDSIVPCGITEYEVTSIAREREREGERTAERERELVHERENTNETETETEPETESESETEMQKVASAVTREFASVFARTIA